MLRQCIKVSIAQRAEQDSQEILNEGFQQLFNGQEPIESMLFRKDSFKKVWDNVNNDISVSIQFYNIKKSNVFTNSTL